MVVWLNLGIIISISLISFATFCNVAIIICFWSRWEHAGCSRLITSLWALTFTFTCSLTCKETRCIRLWTMPYCCIRYIDPSSWRWSRTWIEIRLNVSTIFFFDMAKFRYRLCSLYLFMRHCVFKIWYIPFFQINFIVSSWVDDNSIECRWCSC